MLLKLLSYDTSFADFFCLNFMKALLLLTIAVGWSCVILGLNVFLTSLQVPLLVFSSHGKLTSEQSKMVCSTTWACL